MILEIEKIRNRYFINISHNGHSSTYAVSIIRCLKLDTNDFNKMAKFI